MTETFDVQALIDTEQALTVKLQDGTVCRSVTVTPKVRRELRSVDRGLTEQTAKLRGLQRVEESDTPDLDLLREGLDIIDDVEDAVYSKLVLLLHVDGSSKHPTLGQVTSMGDKLATKLYERITLDAEGNASESAALSPTGTTTTS